MAEVTLFKNSHGNVNVALKSGNSVAFVSGRFFTTNKALENELQAAADNANEFGVFVDAQEPVIDTDYATPIDQMKKRMRDELLAELKASGRLVDAGVSSQTLTQQGLSTSQSVAGQAEQTEEQRKLAEQQTGALQGTSTAPQTTVPAPTAEGSTLSALEKLKLGIK